MFKFKGVDKFVLTIGGVALLLFGLLILTGCSNPFINPDYVEPKYRITESGFMPAVYYIVEYKIDNNGCVVFNTTTVCGSYTIEDISSRW